METFIIQYEKICRDNIWILRTVPDRLEIGRYLADSMADSAVRDLKRWLPDNIKLQEVNIIKDHEE